MKYLKSFEDVSSYDITIYDNTYYIQENSLFRLYEASSHHSVIRRLYSYPPLTKEDKKKITIGFDLRKYADYITNDLEDAINMLKVLYDQKKYNI